MIKLKTDSFGKFVPTNSATRNKVWTITFQPEQNRRRSVTEC